MAVRIEITEIPTETISTTIVSIPASEWRSMKWKEGIFGALSLILAMASMFGFIALAAGAPLASERLGFAIKSDIDLLRYVGTMLIGALPVIFGIKKLFKWVESIEPNLLMKHGWNVEPRYRVELDEGGFYGD